MHMIIAALRRVFAAGPADPTESFTPRDWADLPVHHPQADGKTAR